MTNFVSGLRQATPAIDGRIRFWLVTNLASRACREACGVWPPPAWLGVAASPAAIAAIEPPAKVFALRYGADADIEKAWQALRRRYWDAGCDAGLTGEELDRLASWRLRHAAPGVLPAEVAIEPLPAIPPALGGVAGVRR